MVASAAPPKALSLAAVAIEIATIPIAADHAILIPARTKLRLASHVTIRAQSSSTAAPRVKLATKAMC
jgi:hypothetical protein